MRRIIAALQVSLDGLIEGPNEEFDWGSSGAPNWREEPRVARRAFVGLVLIIAEVQLTTGVQ
jgi:hypothetical protein